MPHTITARLSLGNNRTGISPIYRLWLHNRMEISELRRKNLRLLVSSPPFNGNQAEFAEKIGVKPPQVSRWLSTTTADPRAITERSARKIEEALKKPRGWLDLEDHISVQSVDDSFLTAITEASADRNIPDHIKQSILTLISSSPKKTDAK